MRAGFDPGQSDTPTTQSGESSGAWGLRGRSSTSSGVRTHTRTHSLHMHGPRAPCVVTARL